MRLLELVGSYNHDLHAIYYTIHIVICYYIVRSVVGAWGSLSTWVCTVYLNVCSSLVRFLLLSQILFYLNLSWMFLLRFRVYISNCILVVLTMFQCLFPQWVLALRYAL